MLGPRRKQQIGDDHELREHDQHPRKRTAHPTANIGPVRRGDDRNLRKNGQRKKNSPVVPQNLLDEKLEIEQGSSR